MSCVAVPMIIANGFSLILASQATGTPPMLRGFGDDMPSSQVIGQLVIFLTTLAGFAYTLYRERRNRKWDQEDRERARLELIAETERAAHKVTKEVAAVESRATKQRATLIEKIEEHAEISKDTNQKLEEQGRKLDENTQISIDAFRESNNVNRKLADIRRSFEQVAIRKPPAGEDTSERVKDSERKS